MLALMIIRLIKLILPMVLLRLSGSASLRCVSRKDAKDRQDAKLSEPILAYDDAWQQAGRLAILPNRLAVHEDTLDPFGQ